MFVNLVPENFVKRTHWRSNLVKGYLIFVNKMKWNGNVCTYVCLHHPVHNAHLSIECNMPLLFELGSNRSWDPSFWTRFDSVDCRCHQKWSENRKKSELCNRNVSNRTEHALGCGNCSRFSSSRAAASIQWKCNALCTFNGPISIYTSVIISSHKLHQ